jgi:hypothetical protein
MFNDRPKTAAACDHQVAIPQEPSESKGNLYMKKIFLGVSLLLMVLTTVNIVRAQDVILDDVETATETEWAQIRIHFTLPVNYVRHFPQERGQLLQIFFTVAGLDSQNISLREEIRNVSATPVMPATTITYDPPLSLNLQRDPSSLSVRFDRPVNYDVRPGEDHRSLVIYLPIVPTETKPTDATKSKPERKKDNHNH